MLGLAAVRIRGAQRKGFCVDLYSEHVPWALRGPGCLVCASTSEAHCCQFLGRLHHQRCLQWTASLYWQFTYQSWHGVSQAWVPINETNTWDTETHAGPVLSALLASLHEAFPTGVLARVSFYWGVEVGPATTVASLIQAIFSFYFTYISLPPLLSLSSVLSVIAYSGMYFF